MKPDDFKRLVAAGLSTDQIAVVMEMMDRDARAVAEAEEARKAKGRDRVARWREARNVTETQPKVTVRLTGGDARGEDKTSTQRIEPQEQEERKKRATSALSPEFDEFWSVFPNKTAKPAAAKAYAKALHRATAAEIMAGLRRYIAGKPADRSWLNPSTFLNNDRWDDLPASVSPSARDGPRSAIPNQADVFHLVAMRTAPDDRQEPEDRSGFRAAIPHLRPAAVRER